MVKLEQKESDGAGGRGRSGPRLTGKERLRSLYPDRDEASIDNELLLRRIAKETGGDVFSCSSSLSMLAEFRSRSVRPVTKYRGPLEIGPLCTDSISVWCYSKTAQQNLPTLSRMTIKEAESKVDEEAEDEMGGGGDEEEAEGMKGKGPGGRKPKALPSVKRDQQFWSVSGDENIHVPREEQVRGFRYGKQIIPFTDEDLASLKLENPKSLKALGFLHQDQVARHWYVCMYVCACYVCSHGGRRVWGYGGGFCLFRCAYVFMNSYIFVLSFISFISFPSFIFIHSI